MSYTHLLWCPGALTRLVRLHGGRWLDIGYEPWAGEPAYYVDDGFGTLILYCEDEDA